MTMEGVEKNLSFHCHCERADWFVLTHSRMVYAGVKRDRTSKARRR